MAAQLGAKRGGPKWLPNKRITFVIDTDRTLLDVIHTEVSMGAHADKALAVLKAPNRRRESTRLLCRISWIGRRKTAPFRT